MGRIIQRPELDGRRKLIMAKHRNSKGSKRNQRRDRANEKRTPWL